MLIAIIGTMVLPAAPMEYVPLEPVDEASLATVHASTPLPVAPTAPSTGGAPLMATSVAWEQLDNWWAAEGATIYANARRPVAIDGAWTGFDPLHPSALTIGLHLSVAASSRD